MYIHIQLLRDVICDAIQRSKPDVLFLDWVTSNTALKMPVAEIAASARSLGVGVIVVDGAHLAGSIANISISRLGADIVVGNLHKHFCLPKGCGFVWSSSSLKNSIHPVLISHGYGSPFSSEFVWDGTRDYSPMLSFPCGLQIWEALSAEKVYMLWKGPIKYGLPN